MDNRVLSGQGLYKAFRSGKRDIQAVNGVSIDMEKGRLGIIYGPSGSGKTTLLNLLSGLERPDRGRVLIEDTDTTQLSLFERSSLRGRSIGYIFQQYNLINSMTVWENVKLAVHIAQKSIPDSEIESCLLKLGLGECMREKAVNLSGGEQQRVAIARAIIKKPILLFADEPTGNLDTANGIAIMELISSLVKSEQLACMLVTHNPAWEEYADDIIRMKDGQIVQQVM